ASACLAQAFSCAFHADRYVVAEHDGSRRVALHMWRTPSRPPPIATAGKGGEFPSVVSLTNGRALAAWEDDGKIAIRPLREASTLTPSGALFFRTPGVDGSTSTFGLEQPTTT